MLVTSYAAQRVRSVFGARDKFSVSLHHSLKAHAGFVERHVAELAQDTSRAVQRHKKDILHRQLVVERLADMAMELYARATTIARTQRLIEERGVDTCAREIALTDLFCLQSGRRFRALRMELEGDAGVAMDDLRRSIASTVRADAGYASDDALLDVPVPPLPKWSLNRDEQALGQL